MLTKQQFEDAEYVEMTVEEARADEAPESLTTAIDNAQARVFGGDAKEAFVIIKIA